MENEKMENKKIEEGEMENIAGGYDLAGMISLDKEEQDILREAGYIEGSKEDEDERISLSKLKKAMELLKKKGKTHTDNTPFCSGDTIMLVE